MFICFEAGFTTLTDRLGRCSLNPGVSTFFLASGVELITIRSGNQLRTFCVLLELALKLSPRVTFSARTSNETGIKTENYIPLDCFDCWRFCVAEALDDAKLGPMWIDKLADMISRNHISNG